MVRVAVVGPECSGKTTLSLALGERFGASVVPEIARDWLPALGRPYEEADLAALARAQWQAERSAPGPLVVCDTTLLVVRIWSQVRYGRVDPWIVQHEELGGYALHLLCVPDLPWEADPLREHPTGREGLLDRYREALRSAGVPVVEVRGAGAARTRIAFDAVRTLLGAG